MQCNLQYGILKSYNALKKILLISPREPSGMSWLINCFLELNIKTYRRRDPNWMWHTQADGSYVLNPQEQALVKWLPALSKATYFRFREDVEVQFTHEFPIKDYTGIQTIYFIRDPRDSFYSRYRRENPGLSFNDFVNVPDSDTLLCKIDNWVLFNLYWLKHKKIKVFRFEDYKSNAANTLRSVLDYVNLKPEPEDFQKAIMSSTVDKARESELQYRKMNYSDVEIINRAGSVSEWKEISNIDDVKVIDSIEQKSSDLLRYFGYELRGSIPPNGKLTFYPNVLELPFFKELEFSPSKVLQDKYRDSEAIHYVLGFANLISQEWIDRSKIGKSDIGVLLNSLLIFLKSNPDEKLKNKIVHLIGHYDFVLIDQSLKSINISFVGKIKRSIKKIIS
jgi:hypothetical protein